MVKIYNLCIEKGLCIDDSYLRDFSKFKVNEFQCLDHEPHNFVAIFEFNIDALIYLSYTTKNIIAVHCKAGKGRTGFMISSLLIFLGFKNEQDKGVEGHEEEAKMLNEPRDNHMFAGPGENINHQVRNSLV